MSELITKTRKNRISKKQRTECFLAALGSFLVEAKKYQHAPRHTKD